MWIAIAYPSSSYNRLILLIKFLQSLFKNEMLSCPTIFNNTRVVIFFLTLILARSLFITCLITHGLMNQLHKKYLVLLELTPWLFSRSKVQTSHFPSLFTWPPTLAWQINFSNRLRLQDISRLAFKTAISPTNKCYISYNLITPFLTSRDDNLTRTRTNSNNPVRVEFVPD